MPWQEGRKKYCEACRGKTWARPHGEIRLMSCQAVSLIKLQRICIVPCKTDER
jgi:hypothetical protein